MKYLVMECHTAYAVVLDENGKYLKVANMRYEVGQTVTDVVELNVPQPKVKRKLNIKMISTLATVACLILVFIPIIISRNNPYASVYMKINPEVRIDVDKNELVVNLTAVNEDGKTLLEGYEFKEKNLDTVLNELVDKAIELEYLKEGGKVSVTLEADDDIWMQSKSTALNTELTERLTEKMPVTIEIKEKHRHHRDDDDDDDDDDDEYEEDDDDDDEDEDEDDDDRYENGGDDDDDDDDDEGYRDNEDMSNHYGDKDEDNDDDDEENYDEDDIKGERPQGNKPDSDTNKEDEEDDDEEDGEDD